MQNTQNFTPKASESVSEKTEYDVDTKVLEKYAAETERKRKDISLLKRVSNILISAMEIPSILLKISQGHSIVINGNGEIFTGRVNTDKLKNLGVRIAGKTDGSFDINAEVSHDITMLENQELKVGKQYVNAKKVLETSTRLFKNKGNVFAELFMDAWKYQAEKHADNVQIDAEVSPMGHHYLLVKIKGMPYYGKIAEKTGNLMYIVYYDETLPIDKREIPV